MLVAALMAAVLLAAAGVTVWAGGGPGEPETASNAGSATTGPAGAPAVPGRDPLASRGSPRTAPGGESRAQRRQIAPASPQTAEPEEPQPAADAGGGDVVDTGSCQASHYGEPQPTASGEAFDPEAMTAAHLTWDFGTRVRVTNPANGQSVVVRINDRGPYIDGRCLDLARGAFREIASLNSGVIPVRYEVLSD